MDQGPIIVLQEIRLNYQQNKMIDSPVPILSLIYYVLFYLKNSMFVKMPREREREGERSLCCLVDSVHMMVR